MGLLLEKLLVVDVRGTFVEEDDDVGVL